MAANELFGDEPSNGNGSSDTAPAKTSGKNGGNGTAKPIAKAKATPAAVSASASAATALADEPLTDPFAGEDGETLSSESSSEPGGAAPLMASPTSPEVYAAPPLPERIAEARKQNGTGPELFAGEGLTFERRFTKEGQDVFDSVEWELRNAVISGDKGEVVFEQKDCEIPKAWSMLATNVVVSKYFRGKVGTPQRESSVRQLISRVADTIYNWGKQGNYFATEQDADVFHDELKYLLLHQHMAFNSPVWFNLGVPGERPQVSACQPYDALVSTPQGLLPIGRLVEENAVGTTIYDAHGTTRIVATKANGRKEVLRVHTKSGYSLDVTGDHLVWRANTDVTSPHQVDDGDFVPAGTLRNGDLLTIHAPTGAGKTEAALHSLLNSKLFCEQANVFYALPITRIEPLGEMEVYDIQTESGEYLSGNIRVHNCFINKVEDTMESILTLAKTEGMLFKWGSGTGTNLSVIRSSKEGLKGGGTASGPVSFMRGFDAFAGAIKCLTPDALVHTDKGMQTLGEIIDPALAPGFHENDSVVLATKDGPTRISHVYVSPEAKTFRLTLQHTNLSLRGTADHPVLTLTPDFALVWKKLPDLQKGDRVAVSRRTEMWPDTAPSFADFAPVTRYAKKTLSYPSEMTPELARLLGYMVSEGCMDAERFRFCNADKDTFDDFLHCVQTVFGVADVSRNVSARVHPETNVTTHLFEACWTNALRFFKYVGLTEAKSSDKVLPWSVRQSPRPLVAQFLRAYFDGDGHVGINVYASSASEQLLREIQLLLLNMGMVGLLRPHPVQGKMYWSLYLRGEAAWQFVREIGFVSARKNALCQFAGDKNTNIDTVPFLADVLRARTRKNGYCQCADGQTRNIGFGFFNRKPESGISYNRLRATPQLADKLRVVDPALADTLDTVMEREFFWDKVAGVEEAAPAVTYDFTVPGTHSFVANGIVNHNSGGKCFKAGSLISTPDGLVPIETLQTGDLVLTHVGPRPLADFMPNGVKMCFRVQTEEGYELEVTRGHKFAFWNEWAGQYDVKPIEEFAPGEAMYVLTEASEGGQTIPLFVPPANDAPQATTTAEMPMPNELCPKLAYVLGLMYGDGELRTTYPFRVRVAFCKDAAGQASEARFRDYCAELFGEEPITLGDETNHRQVGYTRKRLIEFLAANNLAKGKANALQFPVALFQARLDVRAAFAAGIIDADGTYQARGGWSVSMIDRPFLVQFQRLLLSLGVPSKLRLSRAAKDNWQNLYRLHVMGHTFVDRLVKRIAPYSAKAVINYVPSSGADKGWGYRPSLLPALASRIEKRGGYTLLERRVGQNSTTGYGALAAVAATHPHLAVSSYAGDLARCVQVHLLSVTPTEMAETYDVEVEDAHLLCANGIYASNTRRAAKMSILNADHPDIVEFVECKADAEKKAHALIEAGYSGAFNVPNGAYDSVFFQNANHSVRATDDFMRAVELDRDWTTAAITNGEPMETMSARDLMHKISQAAWVCGDPGMQFDTTANRWHTCGNTDRINASNPCCFVGETLVNTTEGLVRFDRLEEMDAQGVVLPLVPSWDKTANAPALRPINKVWVAGYTNTLFDVTTEDGITVRCTPEHRFLTFENQYVPANELIPGTRLRRLGQFGTGGKNDARKGDMPRPYDVVLKTQAVTLPEAVAVYDLEVEGTHNFGVVQAGFAGQATLAVSNSEFFFLDDTACNLASLNLMRFRTADHEFDVDAFRAAVQVTVSAMEIMVGFAAYPTDKITVNSFDYRPLGLGYANLGALLMARGLAYDSDEGRAYAAAITAILSGEGYTQSAKLAARVGPFAGYEKNRQPMLRVMQMHRDHVEAMQKELIPPYMVDAARKTWDAALDGGREHGFRNSQISVLAPTGCLVPGSLVVTDKGLLRLDRLGNTDGEKWQEVNFRVLTDEGERPADKFFVNGLDWTRRIVTKAGYAIEGTLKHRVKVVDTETGNWTWKRFADLAPGDVAPLSMGQLAGQPQTVALPPLGEEYWTDERRLRGDYTTRAPQTMTPELAELIGYFMGDGSMHSKGPRFCVANADTDVALRVQTLVKSLFNVNAHLSDQQGYCEVAVHSVPLALWWDACGFAKRSPSENHSGKGYVPHIPDAVLASNDKAVYGAFLRGLYEADGTVTNGVPCWTTVQKTFSEEVKTLLLALGLPTVSDTTQTGWGNSTAYRLRLRNSGYADAFRAAVGFMGARKAALVTKAQGEQTARHDYVYLGRELVDELLPATHLLRNAATLAMRRHNGAITRRTAQALLAETNDGRVAHALRFFYDTVAANEDGGMQPTFDISVPENLTYVAQGFVSHNTIGFLMDCDTTGVEPDIAIVKYKSLVGGGMFKIVNQTVPEALTRLGYSASERKAILDYIEQNDTIEGAPGLSDAHLSVFDCAFRAKNGSRTIHYMGHIKMMSSVQPFISGAISKCVTGETLITSDKGIVPIGAFYNGEKPGEFRECNLTVASVSNPQKADLFYYGGVRPTVKLSLGDGRTIEGTHNHRVKVASKAGYDWKRLDEITPDDFVAIRLGTDVWASENVPIAAGFAASKKYGNQKEMLVPETMNGDLARFLGYYIAEGNIARSNWTVRVTNNNPVVLANCERIVLEQFGLTGKIVTDARNGVQSFIVSSKGLVELLDFLGCEGDSSTKVMPWSILQSGRDVVRAFVGGLWLDGYVRQDGMVAICLNSPQLLRQLQVVLNNFGLRPNIISKWCKSYNKSFDELGLFGADARTFHALFELDDTHKTERLAALCQTVKKVNAIHSDVVPCYRDLATEAIRQHRDTMNWRHVLDKRTGNMSWDTAQKLYQAFGITQLGEIVENNIHFVPIREIAEGMAPVYDFQVPENHAFLGNGIVNHNTVNMPHDATPEDMGEAYMQAWKLGIKALAIYRDGSKKTQPLSTGKAEEKPEKQAEPAAAPVVEARPLRRRLPDERQALTHKFSVGGHEGYITIGLYPDQTPGEIFITMSKEGSVVSGLMDAFATSISLALQYGVPLRTLVEKFMHSRFEPSGFTGNPQIPMAKSIMDYLFRYMALKFLDKDERANVGLIADQQDDYDNDAQTDAKSNPFADAAPKPQAVASAAGTPGGQAGPQGTASQSGQTRTQAAEREVFVTQADAPPCPECGSITTRNGACYRCNNCGTSIGCS